MSDQQINKVDFKQRFEVCLQARNLEIDLFWKRSIFFWGFIAAAFAAYAVLKNHKSDLTVIVACFGMVCSFAWALLNRGSKYWQENWEAKVANYEDEIIGEVFKKHEPVQAKGIWSASRFSVSKLAIGLSDYIFVMWTALVVWEVASKYSAMFQEWSFKDCGMIIFILLSFCYLGVLFVCGRSTKAK